MRFAFAIVALCAAGLVILDARHWRTGDPRHASFRTVVVSVLILLGLTLGAQARPSPYLPVTQFNGDRYSAHTQMGPDVVRAVKAKTGAKPRYLHPTRKRPSVSRKQIRDVPVPVPRPLAYEPYRVEAPITVIDGAGREVARVIGGRPQGCPWRFCGCGASLHLFGRIIPALNLAANWLRFPRTLPAPSMVAARRGHVFILVRHISGRIWLAHDSNSGGHRTRVHPRSIAGYTIVNPHGGST